MLSSKRENCVVCDSSLTNNRFLYTFKDFPLYMGISTDDNDLFADMPWIACEKCGTVQLHELIDPEVLYQRPHNPSIGSTWLKHHTAFSEFVRGYGGKRILEIGGGNQILQDKILEDDSIESYTTVDVHEYKECSDERVTHIKGYIDSESDLDVDCDTIIHSHTFEHFYKPIEQVKAFAKLLEPGQKMVFSAPNVYQMVIDKFTNALNFEHTFMVSERNLRYILAAGGFEVEEIVHYSPHNFFVSAVKKETVLPELHCEQLEAHTFNNFVQHYNLEAWSINKKLDRPAYLFGCHIFSQYLLSFGLKEESFVAILDNDKGKIGHKLYGTNLMTHSPSVLKDVEEPLVVLKAGVYTEEIKRDILETHNPNTKFIL